MSEMERHFVEIRPGRKILNVEPNGELEDERNDLISRKCDR
jgi:hypothetical protein